MFSNVTVGHDFTIQQSAKSASWQVTSNRIGHDATFQNNAGAIDFENNQVTHDAVFQNNSGSVTVKGNTYTVSSVRTTCPRRRDNAHHRNFELQCRN